MVEDCKVWNCDRWEFKAGWRAQGLWQIIVDSRHMLENSASSESRLQLTGSGVGGT